MVECTWQVFAHPVAQEVESVEPQRAVLNQASVTDRIFQPHYQYELEKDDGGK